MLRILILTVAAIAAAAAQPAVLRQSFDSDADAWTVMGTNGSVKISKDSKIGAGALAFTYSLDSKGMTTAVLPAGAGHLAGMERIRFWMKSDHDTAVAVLLSEKKPGGGDYTATLWAPKNVWQRVDLRLSDFMLNDGLRDPADADGRLDPDQIEGVGVLDLSSFFNQMPTDMPVVVARSTGQHTLLIDELEVLAGETGKQSPLVIDAFDRGFLQWMTLGGMELSLAPGDNPIGGAALSAAIQGVEGKLSVMVRRARGSDLAGAKRIAFDVAAERESTLAISVETYKAGTQSGQGPRYSFLIYPPSGRKVFHVNVSLADFEHDANSPDDSGATIDASRIRAISIGDVTALTGGVATGNRIWIGRVEMLK